MIIHCFPFYILRSETQLESVSVSKSSASGILGACLVGFFFGIFEVALGGFFVGVGILEDTLVGFYLDSSILGGMMDWRVEDILVKFFGFL